jgi:predicted nucleic acid-binding protein
MAMEFLDTNIILRYVTKDDPDQSARSLAFLQELEAGRRTVATCEGVVVEVVQVLESKRLYNFPRAAIHAALTDVIRMRGIRLPHKRTYLRALDLYASTKLDFVDALAVAHMERATITTIVSFDRDFDDITGITRREP